MASPDHTFPSPSISDVMNLLCAMKKENDEAMKEILTKLTRIEDDNRILKQELHEIKSSQKRIVKVSSRKRDEPEYDSEAKHNNEHSNNKKAKVSVASLPEPLANFDTLDDDCLGNVLDFVGKKCYSAFGRVNKRCHEMFCLKGLPKETYLYGYGSLHLIQQQQDTWDYCDWLSNGVLHYNRRDIFDWMLTDESGNGYERLKYLCWHAIEESRLDILREVFQRANVRQLEYLRECDNGIDYEENVDLCYAAAEDGNLECMKLLKENGCEWDKDTWVEARCNGYEHILEYLRNNGYPTEWQVESDSE